MTYEEFLSKYGFELEHEMHDGGKWYIHSTKGSIIIDPEGRWEWTRLNGSLSKGFNPRDLEKALSKGESVALSKASIFINMLESVGYAAEIRDEIGDVESASVNVSTISGVVKWFREHGVDFKDVVYDENKEIFVYQRNN